jgi:D-glycero-alpha-D-manno-heptose-7-phosphate kinase
MIITKTPLRISFLGGGTDYPEYFSKYGGQTLATSIDKYTYITVTPLTDFFDHRIRISYSKTELCKEVDEIQHPSVRECLRLLGIQGGIEINIVSDLPARSGLGSSSCFTVGLLNALHAHKGEMVGRERLAEEAVHVEREMIKERVGLQDQYSCAHGGLNLYEFSGSRSVRITPIPIRKMRLLALENCLMLFYTGMQRLAHEILEEQIKNTAAGDISQNLEELSNLVTEGVDLLASEASLSQFGELLHAGWELKRSFSRSISNPFIDEAYSTARKSGALGGKLLGAGGGGFLLLFATPDRQDEVRSSLRHLKEVTFTGEDLGTSLLYYKR